MLVASQLLQLATSGVINGLASVLINGGGGHQFLVAGTAFDNPVYAAGALSRLLALLDCHPSHPADQ